MIERAYDNYGDYDNARPLKVFLEHLSAIGGLQWNVFESPASKEKTNKP